MRGTGRLGREALACACLGYLAIAIFHTGVRGSTSLVLGGVFATVVLLAS